VNRGRFLAGGAAAVLLPATLVPLARADVSEGDLAYANFAIACEYSAFATLLTDAGQTGPVADDFAFAWPAKTFRSLGAAAETGAAIEAAVVGAYISAATTISVETYRSLFARALADEAGHLAVLSWVATGKPVGNSFPPALDLEAATTVVGPYLG
jgi:Ferritin-like domain